MSSIPNKKTGYYMKSGHKYKYTKKRDAKIKSKHKGKTWRGDTKYSKRNKGWI